ncbi:FO synthase subunit 1 [Durusdinium trenchii]|uniref:FO synthase subunit 1 n=1 Tax=Durusdinium trenchii TaxID=1381693 RepID=A0ABP0QKM7_9DINO
MAGSKRKSGGGDNPKTKAAKPSESSDPAVSKILEWFQTSVVPLGGVDKYIEQTYKTQAQLKELAEWIDNSFPPNPRFRTDSENIQGAERVAIMRPDPTMLEKPHHECSHILSPSDYLAPFSVAYVKGWRRCTTLLCAFCGIKALGIDLALIPSNFKAILVLRNAA